jgi:hypothetical protein
LVRDPVPWIAEDDLTGDTILPTASVFAVGALLGWPTKLGLPAATLAQDEPSTAYDRRSPVGKWEKTLNEVPKAGRVVVNMKPNWRVVHSRRKANPRR